MRQVCNVPFHHCGCSYGLLTGGLVGGGAWVHVAVPLRDLLVTEDNKWRTLLISGSTGNN
jgi:hypothetical protein